MTGKAGSRVGGGDRFSVVDPRFSPAEESGTRWRRLFHGRLIWIWVAVALIVYELTSEAAYSVAIVCLEFGRSYFQSAFWLRGADPDRGRGKACFWFYVAAGLARVCGTACIAMADVVAFALARELGARRRPQPLDFELAQTVTVLFGSLFLSAVATYVGLAKAWRHNVRIWVSRDVERSRRRGEFPPRQGRVNQARSLIIVSLLPSIAIALFAIFFCLLLAMEVRQAMGAWIAIIFAGLLLSAIVFIAWGSDFLTRRVVAKTPQQCWPDAQ